MPFLQHCPNLLLVCLEKFADGGVSKIDSLTKLGVNALNSDDWTLRDGGLEVLRIVSHIENWKG